MWVGGRRFPNQALIANRRRAEHDALRAEAEVTLDGRAVAHASSDLHTGTECLDDALDELALDPPPATSSFEIDHVKVMRNAPPRSRERHRIRVVDGHLVVVALVQ